MASYLTRMERMDLQPAKQNSLKGTGRSSDGEKAPGFGIFTVTVALLIGLSRRKLR